MKKMMCLLLVLGIALGLSGCVTEWSDQLQSWAWEAMMGTEETSTAYVPEEGYMPRVYNYRSGTTESGDRSCSYRIPAIEMPGPAVERINREIEQTYLPMTEPYTGGPAEALPYKRIDYKWAVKGDVLSLVIMAWGSDDGPDTSGFGYEHCAVYNVSVTDCRLLEDEEVYGAAGIDGIETHVKRAVASCSGEWYLKSGNSGLIFSEENKALTVEAFDQSLSEERFASAMPYYDEHNRLCVMAELCDPVTEERFWADICLDDYKSEGFHSAGEYYDYYIGMVG